MITFNYILIHLPTGKRFLRQIRYDSLRQFYHHLVKWNTEQPEVWVHVPTGDNGNQTAL